MAKNLGVPPNTLSRWETGATTPDAETLAALYSLGAVEGVPPQFFLRRKLPPKPASKGRPRLLVMWDLQRAGVQALDALEVDSRIRAELESRFAAASYRLFKLFSTPSYARITDALSDGGWRVWEDYLDMDGELMDHAMSDCGQEPEATNFVLIANEGGYVELIKDLEEQGVLVHLLTVGSRYDQTLVQAVPRGRWMQVN